LDEKDLDGWNGSKIRKKPDLFKPLLFYSLILDWKEAGLLNMGSGPGQDEG